MFRPARRWFPVLLVASLPVAGPVAGCATPSPASSATLEGDGGGAGDPGGSGAGQGGSLAGGSAAGGSAAGGSAAGSAGSVAGKGGGAGGGAGGGGVAGGSAGGGGAPQGGGGGAGSAGLSASGQGGAGSGNSPQGGAGGGGGEGGSAGGGEGGSGGGGAGGEVAVTIHEDSTITQPTTWAAGVHEQEVSLDIHATLTVEPCSEIRLKDGVIVIVSEGGALSLIGTADCPITITSARTSPAPGDWGYIEIDASASGPDTVLRHVTVEYGGGLTYGSIWVAPGASIEISDSTVRRSASVGVEARPGAKLRSFAGNTLTQSDRPLVVGVNEAGELGPGTYTGNKTDVIELAQDTVTADATWQALGVPFRTVDGFSIGGPQPAVLTLAAGAVLQLGSAANLTVDSGGGLTLDGAADSPATITSAQQVPAPGDWGYVQFLAGSVKSGCALRHAVIEHGGGLGYGSIYLAENASVEISDSTVRHSADVGVEARLGASLRNFAGNTLSDCAKEGLVIDPDHADSLGPGVYGPNKQDGVRLLSGSVQHVATWLDLGVPYLAPDGVVVDGQPAALTLGEGVMVKMGAGAAFAAQISSKLFFAGTAARHVTITSLLQPPSPGDWNQIELRANGNTLAYADISFGGGSSYGQLWLDDSASATISHLAFSGSKTCDLAGNGTLTTSASNGVKCP